MSYLGPERWSSKRKAELLAAIDRGDVTTEAALEIHAISAEELQSWRDRFALHGRRGLEISKLRDLR